VLSAAVCATRDVHSAAEARGGTDQQSKALGAVLYSRHGSCRSCACCCGGGDAFAASGHACSSLAEVWEPHTPPPADCCPASSASDPHALPVGPVGCLSNWMQLFTRIGQTHSLAINHATDNYCTPLHIRMLNPHACAGSAPAPSPPEYAHAAAAPPTSSPTQCRCRCRASHHQPHRRHSAAAAHP